MARGANLSTPTHMAQWDRMKPMPLHPVIEAMLEANRTSGRPAYHEASPVEARSLLAASCAALGKGPEVESVQSLIVPTRTTTIPARLYRVQSGADAGLILYVHGGGWVLGALDDFDALSRVMAARTGCAVLLIDYRLAPEHPFPQGLEDVEDALLWASRHRTQLVGNHVPLVLAGDSAGANLATVALIGLRERIDVACQVLFYPATDCDMERASYRQFAEGLFLSRKDMEWFFRHYAPESMWPDPRISPVRSESLSGLPPTFIATAEYDVLRDEAEDYASRLAAAGVHVELRRVAGMAHGFARMMNLVDAASDALDLTAQFIASSVRPADGRHSDDASQQIT